MILREKITPAEANYCAALTQVLLDDMNLFLKKGHTLAEKWNVFWHRTRVAEWPWALDWINPGTKVFDVGTDPHFALFLIDAGVEDVTMHHTVLDTQNLGKILLQTHGWVDASPAFKKHDRKLKMVWGYPDQLDVPDEIYDVVTNLSVMEHVEPENWRMWMEATWRWLKPGGLLVMSCDYLLEAAEDGPHVDIVNHPYWEFFSENEHKFLTDERECPWHPQYKPELFVDNPELFRVPHPANSKGIFTVYGFVVQKCAEGSPAF
jgi:SAM-dependent methyltransferase